MERQPIATVPRDGSAVYVWADEVGEYAMRWNPKGWNPLVQPDPVGIWESVRGGFTWSERDGCGPTHWRPFVAGLAAQSVSEPQTK